MPGNQADEIIRVSENVIYQMFEGESVLLNIATEKYYGLDDVGSNIWQLITELGTKDTVLARLCDHYDADKETLHRDLDCLVISLLREGLLTVTPAGENAAG